MERAAEQDVDARNANAEELVGLLMLRQATVTTVTKNNPDSPNLPIYRAARDGVAAEIVYRLKLAESKVQARG